MKKLVFLLALALLPTYLLADILITEDGDKIEAYEVEIASSYIYYKDSKTSANVQRIEKSKVLLWKKEDGTKVTISGAEQTSDNSQSVSPKSDNALSPEIKRENQRRIDEYNGKISSFTLKKIKKGDARGGLLLMMIDDDSQLYNGELTMSFRSGLAGYYTNYMSTFPVYSYIKLLKYNYMMTYYTVTLENVSDHIIYIDKASTSLIVNGNSECYYKGVSVSQNVSSTRATTAALPYGITLGGGTTTGTSTTQTELKIISIPPHSKITLQEMLVPPAFNGNSDDIIIDASTIIKYTGVCLNAPGSVGQLNDVNPNLMSIGFSVKYSFSEDMQNAKCVNVTTHSPKAFCYGTKGQTLENIVESWSDFLVFPIFYK